MDERSSNSAVNQLSPSQRSWRSGGYSTKVASHAEPELGLTAPDGIRATRTKGAVAWALAPSSELPTIPPELSVWPLRRFGRFPAKWPGWHFSGEQGSSFLRVAKSNRSKSACTLIERKRIKNQSVWPGLFSA
jgi:hypothetical protein